MLVTVRTPEELNRAINALILVSVVCNVLDSGYITVRECFMSVPP